MKKLDWKNKNLDNLVNAFLSIETSKEMQSFLRDLMTEGEILEFSKRLQAANMLSENIVYTQIENETGLSSTTVARVSKWLQSKGGGYKSVLSKLHHHIKNKKLQRDLS